MKREETRHGGREKMIDDIIVKAAGLRCGMTNAEALAMYAQIVTGIWPTHDSKYLQFLEAMGSEEAIWRPGKKRIEFYD